MKLLNLIKDTDGIKIIGDVGKDVSKIAFDSREVIRGTLFAAIRGTISDGHDYIGKAIESGALAILCEQLPEDPPDNITFLVTGNSRHALARLASAWYGHPSREITLVGITGTNGKTTIATLLYKVNTGLGYKAGILTTIQVVINDKSYPATHTTPDPLQINSWLRKMVDAGCEYCFMEVSSHAVSQHRVAGLAFDGGVFTNITHDHLDYHQDFRSYLEAKRSFFDQLSPEAFALTNADEKNGEVMLQQSRARKYRYSLGRISDFQGRVIESTFQGMGMQICQKEVWVRLTGRFNAYNIMAVFGVCMLLGHKEEQVMMQISEAGAAEGRFEVIMGSRDRVAIIDYAHTDDALKNVLETIHEVDREGRQIITVIGAGGDRDRTKRPKMSAVASALSHRVILTSDNPRSEDPLVILEDMKKGIPEEKSGMVLSIPDREEAIKTACAFAAEHSVILVAGKGHEKYQEIKGVKMPFDDKEVVKRYLI